MSTKEETNKGGVTMRGKYQNQVWLAVVDERILREAAAKKGYNEGMQDGMQKGIYTVAPCEFRAIADSTIITPGCSKQLTADEIVEILNECK